MNTTSIGFFDSGIGGITTLNSVIKLLPNEHTIYLADSMNSPYGTKSNGELIKICKKNVEFLINNGCKLIVIACNTATTNSISYLRQNYKIPFIGIEPAIKPAALNTKTGKIGVLATKGTLGSNLFEKTSSIHGQNIEIIEKQVNGLVELIEKNIFSGSKIDALLEKYITPMINLGIDKLVLGCTHYALVKNSIEKITKKQIEIVECNYSVALQTKKILYSLNLQNLKKTEINNIIYTNGNENILKAMVDKKFKIFKI
ncbi:MAG: glutamate racemase [Flavobacteriaceae bacterium]|nr:glutamate racemase [Flavobacteriaceae bacterium]